MESFDTVLKRVFLARRELAKTIHIKKQLCEDSSQGHKYIHVGRGTDNLSELTADGIGDQILGMLRNRQVLSVTLDLSHMEVTNKFLNCIVDKLKIKYTLEQILTCVDIKHSDEEQSEFIYKFFENLHRIDNIKKVSKKF